jgi:ABC-type polysaccharide/polyol phosphate export permease
MTYGVNAIRGTLLEYNVATIPLDFTVSIAFTIVMLVIAILLTRGLVAR